MPLHILITGTSAAVSQVTKTIIDRSLHNCKSEIVDYKQLSLSAKKTDYDFAVINDLMADVYYRLPSALNDVPSVLITNNDRILNDPKRFGLFGAIKNTSGGAAGLVAFEKELIAIINNGTHNTLERKSADKLHFDKIMQSPDGSDPAVLFKKTTAPQKNKQSDIIRPYSNSGKIEMIAIGASTGGTDAIIEVVQDLPADTPPIVIVQHMPVGFTKMYADRLDRICKMNAKEAENGDRLQQGLIILGHGSE